MNNTKTYEEGLNVEPLLINQQQACRLLGVGNTTIFHLRTEGQVRSVLVKSNKSNVSGRRMYVLASLREYVAKLQNEALVAQ